MEVRKMGVSKWFPPPADAPRLKREDDAEFKRRWIAFGMALKAQADGYNIDWRGKSFEKWMSEITFAQVWAESQEVSE